NHELARAREVASEPAIALIRLHWWREVVEGAARAHEVASPLRRALEAGWFDPADLLALIDAREAEAEPIPDQAAFLAYARGTAGRLMRVAGKTLGADDPVLDDLGAGYGIAAILRSAPALAARGRELLPERADIPELTAEARGLLSARAPKVALPAALPCVLARRDLDRIERGAAPASRPRGLADRLAVIRAGLSGHI
ncbi:MAG TPA: squalene/phytoene synthase family protein, partial [Acetobacteraceae bacterium]|nr:squalene/phytoene synthase family protein [Acetobacteraceae bacterium]